MKTTNHSAWLSAIADAAGLQGIELPAFDAYGMGALRSTKQGGRFVTVKRRAVSKAQAQADGVEWALWLEQGDQARPVAAFREPLVPKTENVASVLSLLKGWLVDRWTVDETRTAVRAHPRAQSVEDRAPA